MYDTLIIGAGMSGLAAGIRLAHFGQRVAILERHTTIGGLNSFYRLRGRDYDVGLHALTNITPKGTKRGPLARLLRQLRFSWDDFQIAPQRGSQVVFPDARLSFSNDFELLESEVARQFPAQIDNFRQLSTAIVDYDDLGEEHASLSARQVVGDYIDEPLLIEMLFCPLMFYGSAREHDMDWGQFCIMFRSIFLEGLGRPAPGVRLILKLLVKRFRALGGELKLRCGVRRICVQDARAVGVELESGAQLEAARVLSSAGWCETMRLCDDGAPTPIRQVGQLSFCEAIASLDTTPVDIGYPFTITFFNDAQRFEWQRPVGQLCDVRSGVICSPDNFAYDQPLGDEGTLRVTVLADYDRWRGLDEHSYQQQKRHWFDRIFASAARFVPDVRGRIVDTDMFTPNTIVRFTSHDNGAVYGAPEKQLNGTTHLPNLFVCGTDQGFVGIVGSIISGIGMANMHCLRE